MKIRIPWISLVLAFLVLSAAAFLLTQRSSAVAAPPSQARAAWEIPTDAGEAINHPDQFAWELFMAINWPADVDKRAPDPSQPFGAPGVPVTWETWKLQQEVFRPDGSDPGAWDSKPAYTARQLQDLNCFPLQQAVMRGVQEIPCDPVIQAGVDEVRQNQATYDYIRQNKLYNIEGLLAFYNSGQPVKFTDKSVEVKAQWRPINESDKPRYHWFETVVTTTTTITNSTTLTTTTTTKAIKTIWGLTAMHLTSKVLPNWHWSTFEHVDNPYRLPRTDAQGNFINEAWLLPSLDMYACANPPYDCNQAPETVSGVPLKGTKWENYRLRFSQVDFTDSYGNPLQRANSNIEAGFQLGASCMSCHALSTIAPAQPGALTPNTLNFLNPASLGPGPVGNNENGGGGYLGVPDPKMFEIPGDPTHHYLQLDFAWSLGFCPNWANPPKQIPAPGDPPPAPPKPRCGYPPGEAPVKK